MKVFMANLLVKGTVAVIGIVGFLYCLNVMVETTVGVGLF